MLTQRKGASLTLQSGTLQTAQNELSRVGLTLAEGSLVAVDRDSASIWPASARSR